MARIVPPFCFEFWMREMVLGEREGPSRERPHEIHTQQTGRSNKDGKGPEDYFYLMIGTDHRFITSFVMLSAP
jgi:hypothetical protein